MHVMEVVTAGLLFLVALNLVANMVIPTTTDSGHIDRIGIMGSDILRVLDQSPPADDAYDSMLDEALIGDNVSTLREHLDASLPATISYNLTLVAIDDPFRPSHRGGDELDHGVLVEAGKDAIPIISYGESGEESATCHRIVHLHAGRVREASTGEYYIVDEGWYDLTLVLWFEPRGGA